MTRELRAARERQHRFGRDVHQTRLLSDDSSPETPADAVVPVAVADSGTVAAIGYCHESRLPIKLGLIRPLTWGAPSSSPAWLFGPRHSIAEIAHFVS